MKKSIYFLMFILLVISYSQGQYSKTADMPPDLWVKLKTTPENGKFTFSVKRIGIIFSGDNTQFTNCGPKDKVYKHEYRN